MENKNKITNTTKTKQNTLNERPTEPGFNRAITLDELLDEELSEQTWLVEDFIPNAAFTIISGQPTSYKTRFALDLALSIAQGKSLYGELETQQSGVLIVDEESGKALLHRQLLEQGAIKGLPIVIRSLQNFKLTHENVQLLWLDCKQHGLNTVIIDSLSHVHGANENEASEMTRSLKHLQFLTSKGITVLVIHHNRKESQFPSRGGGEVRGSSAIFAIADAQITLTPKADNRVVVKMNKLRYAKRPKPFELLIVGDKNSFGFEYVGNVNEETKLTRLMKDVLELLAVNDKLMQKDMIEALRVDGVKANDKNVPSAITALLKENKIAEAPKEPGAGNATFYALVKEAHPNT